MKRPSDRECGYIEGYAAALQDMILKKTGSNTCSKHYDPMTIDEEWDMMSYAFDMKDGGRSHKFEDYKDIDEIKKVLLNESIKYMQEL